MQFWGRWLAALLLLVGGPARANHLVGTDWQLTPLLGYQVRVRLTVYTDPVGGSGNAVGDPAVTIAAYERGAGPGGTDRLVSTYGLSRTGVRGLPGAGPGCSSVSIAIQELTYEDVLTFDPGQFTNPNGYYFAWERCCRNQILTNIVDGQSAPLAATLRFPAFPSPSSGQQANASPRFGPPPPAVALCLDQPTEVSFAATDADGDSLAYALVAPLGGFTSSTTSSIPAPNPGPYPLVSYTSGFSAGQPIVGSFQLNPRTGLLTGTPTQVGTYAVAVAVREFRGGVLIGENRREMELSVAFCQPNVSPTLTRVRPPAPPDTIVITGGADRCLTVSAADADPGQTLTVRAVGGAPVKITPAQFTMQFPPAPVDVTVCWIDCAQTGPQLLTLVVSDDGCRPSRPDTVRIPVRIVPTPNAPPVLTRDPPTPDTLTVATGETLAFTVIARDPEGRALTLQLQASGAPGLGTAIVQGTGEASLAVRWTPPCTAARTMPYALWLRATDDGCLDSADSSRVLVRVRGGGPASPIDLPNVITPNGDGRNDCFSLGASAGGAAGACTDGFQEVAIFNRWGRRVYSSTNPAFCWNAPDVSPGTYFYLVRSTQRSLRGVLTVERGE